MKRLFRTAGLLAAVTALPIVVNAQGATQLTAAQVTDDVQKFYRTMEDYQANFDQTYTDIAAGDETKSSGKVFFKKPGKMRWDYYKTKDGKPAVTKVLVSNGSEFTIYEAEYHQYYRQCLKDSQLPTALRFLMGTGELKTEFDTKLIPSKKKGVLRLELVPKKSSGKYKKIEFAVEDQTFSVLETTVYDPYGNTNRIVFRTPSINKKLPDTGFQFPPPKGAKALGGSKELKCD